MSAISCVDTSTSPPLRKRRLVKRFCYEWEVDGVTYWIEVPKGFAYRVSFFLILPRYAFEDVSCIHDILYLLYSYLQGRVKHQGLRQQIEKMVFSITDDKDMGTARLTRRIADQVLLSGPEPKWMKWLAYAYARTFGWWMWYDVPQRFFDLIKKN